SAIPALHERAILAVGEPITDGEARRGVRTRNRREGGERRGWVGRWDDHPHLGGGECDCHLRPKRSRSDGSRNRIASRSQHTSWIHGCPSFEIGSPSEPSLRFTAGTKRLPVGKEGGDFTGHQSAETAGVVHRRQDIT